jgi:hypothetical protein
MRRPVHWTKRIDFRSWGFIVGVLMMFALLILTMTGNDKNENLVSMFSTIMGIGFRSAVMAPAIAETEKPPEKEALK